MLQFCFLAFEEHLRSLTEGLVCQMRQMPKILFPATEGHTREAQGQTCTDVRLR